MYETNYGVADCAPVQEKPAEKFTVGANVDAVIMVTVPKNKLAFLRK